MSDRLERKRQIYRRLKELSDGNEFKPGVVNCCMHWHLLDQEIGYSYSYYIKIPNTVYFSEYFCMDTIVEKMKAEFGSDFVKYMKGEL